MPAVADTLPAPTERERALIQLIFVARALAFSLLPPAVGGGVVWECGIRHAAGAEYIARHRTEYRAGAVLANLRTRRPLIPLAKNESRRVHAGVRQRSPV